MKWHAGAVAVAAAALFLGPPAAATSKAPAAGLLPPGEALPARTVERLLLTDAVRVEGRLVAVGERGAVLLGSLDGRSWRAATAPPAPLLTAVRFLGAKRGWAVGHDSVILSTADGGDSWSQQFSAPKEQRPLLDVLFLDPARGFAVGAYGAFYETADGGASWKARPVLEEDRHLNGIVSLGEGQLLIVGESGTLLRSEDAGRTWAPIKSPYAGSLFGAVPLAGGVVVAFGLRGRIIRSVDAGKSWALVDSPASATLMGGAVLPDGTLVLAGAAGTVVASRDAGQTFFPLATGTSRPLAKAIAGEGGLLAFGEGGVRPVALPSTNR